MRHITGVKVKPETVMRGCGNRNEEKDQAIQPKREEPNKINLNKNRMVARKENKNNTEDKFKSKDKMKGREKGRNIYKRQQGSLRTR